MNVIRLQILGRKKREEKNFHEGYKSLEKIFTFHEKCLSVLDV